MLLYINSNEIAFGDLKEDTKMVTTRAIANIFDHFDHNLLTPYAVGFDRMFDRLHDHYALHQTNTGFPPYNIRKEGDSNFVIELALAGLSQDDLEVEIAGNRKKMEKLYIGVFHIVSSAVVGLLPMM